MRTQQEVCCLQCGGGASRGQASALILDFYPLECSLNGQRQGAWQEKYLGSPNSRVCQMKQVMGRQEIPRRENHKNKSTEGTVDIQTMLPSVVSWMTRDCGEDLKRIVNKSTHGFLIYYCPFPWGSCNGLRCRGSLIWISLLGFSGMWPGTSHLTFPDLSLLLWNMQKISYHQRKAEVRLKWRQCVRKPFHTV